MAINVRAVRCVVHVEDVKMHTEYFLKNDKQIDHLDEENTIRIYVMEAVCGIHLAQNRV
jgi:hypothetical protein